MEGHIMDKSCEEFKLSFDGLNADQGIIELEDLTRSLDGWERFWQTSTAIYLNKKLSTKPLPTDIRPEIKIQAFEKATFDVNVVVFIPLGLMVGYDLLKCICKWQVELFKTHVQTKKRFISRKQAITNLEVFAKTYEINAKSKMETARVLDSIDQDLIEFVEPIDKSAKRIIVTSRSMEKKLTVTSSDKRSLKSGYHAEDGIDMAGYEKCRVKFIRINNQTGRALVEFDKPKDINQVGHIYSQIIDPIVKTPKNIYTRAFYEGTFINIWGKIIRSKRSNKFRHWEFSACRPNETIALLEKK